MPGPRGEVTVLLDELKLGSKDALAKLMPLVYRELRRVAGGYMRDERPGHTLQPTALVHELYLQLPDMQSFDWKSRAQFYSVAARMMRNILVDHARRRNAAKRGGGEKPVTLPVPVRLGLVRATRYPWQWLGARRRKNPQAWPSRRTSCCGKGMVIAWVRKPSRMARLISLRA